jgi:hypothetical protein
VVSFPSVVFSVVIDRFNDERLQCKEQAPCAAYLSLKNRKLQEKMLSDPDPRVIATYRLHNGADGAKC